MADEDVATRAPESDAAEKSLIPGDSKVDQGASMGEHCVTDRPTPAGEAPTGELTSLADVECYITKPADYPHSPSKLLLFLTGGTGIHSRNNQIQADKFAAEGFLVVMPDQFTGDPAPTTTTTLPASSSPTIIESLKLGLAETAKSFRIDMWLARHTPTTVLPTLHKVLAAMRDEFADAAANGDGIYGVGYCFGGKYILLLASDPPADAAEPGQRAVGEQSTAEAGMLRKGPALKAGVLAHATSVVREDFVGVANPVGIVAVEQDALFPDEVREAGVEALKARRVEVQSWVHPGVPHGFAVLGDYADDKIESAQKEAFKQMLGFLQAH